METETERTSLVVWWERKAIQERQKLVKPYPLPRDGAGHVVMANFFAIVGLGDERHGTKERLGVLMYMNRPFYIQRFLELWPKVKPEWKNEPTS